MPHQCTACGHTFEDGSKEMLSGCPGCGGTTFQFRPSGAADGTSTDAPDDSDATPPERESGGVAERMGRTATAMRDWMHRDDAPDRSDTAGAPDTAETPDSTDVPDTTDVEDATGSTRTDAGDADTGVETGTASVDERTTGEPTTDETRPADATRPADENRSPDDTRSPATSESDDAAAPDAVASGEDTDDGLAAWPDPPDVSHVREKDQRVHRRRRRAGRWGTETEQATETDQTTQTDRPTETERVAETVDRPTDEPRDDTPRPNEDGLIVADEESLDGSTEDTAQASARSEMARPDELPPRESEAPSSGRVVSEPSGEKPDMAELREELNEQFESIKIVEPGQYELNLMELYDRQEYIISLRENGRYVIQMPEDWLGDRDVP
ncbi:OapC/ArvC family zinc-ribbon domain-containing protein [Halomarina rubra]|uniref:Zn-ribbon containing protein n=1 Tax=Halomarina rubra TaxID=2071873 RepID=A0ABD6AUK0_9EURY